MRRHKERWIFRSDCAIDTCEADRSSVSGDSNVSVEKVDSERNISDDKYIILSKCESDNSVRSVYSPMVEDIPYYEDYAVVPFWNAESHRAIFFLSLKNNCS